MIYFLLPVYNEEENICQTIDQVQQFMGSDEHTIVAVNDGSTDRSLELLEQYSDRGVHVESSIVNMNIGAVFARGLEVILAKSDDPDDVIIIMESDQTSSVDIVSDLVSALRVRKHDVVIASRFIEGGGFRNFQIIRKFYSHCVAFIMKRFFPVGDNISDYSMFFRAYRVGAVRKAVELFGSHGLIQCRSFAANAELLIKIGMITDKISEIPFIYDYSRKMGSSKIRIVVTICEYFLLLKYLKGLQKSVKAICAKA